MGIGVLLARVLKAGAAFWNRATPEGGRSQPGGPFSNRVALCRLEIPGTGRADSSSPPETHADPSE